jgi:hypothetical protein
MSTCLTKTVLHTHTMFKKKKKNFFTAACYMLTDWDTKKNNLQVSDNKTKSLEGEEKNLDIKHVSFSVLTLFSIQ